MANGNTDFRLSFIEKYAMEVVAMSILGMLCWNTFTTYQNTLYLQQIKTEMVAFSRNAEKIDSRMTDMDADIKIHERRISKIEDTGVSRAEHERDQSKMRKWVETELDKKQNKVR